MVELDLDGVSYEMNYRMHAPRAATRDEPGEGGLQIYSVFAILPSYGKPIRIDVTQHDTLRALDKLIDLAHREAKEESEAA